MTKRITHRPLVATKRVMDEESQIPQEEDRADHLPQEEEQQQQVVPRPPPLQQEQHRWSDFRYHCLNGGWQSDQHYMERRYMIARM